MRVLFFLIFILGSAVNLRAQDVLFSQIFNAPSLTNPALTGQNSGNGRIMANYKNQWSSITNYPYRTFLLSIDRVVKQNVLYGGISFLNDQAGNSQLQTNQIAASLASKISISDASSLALGLQAAWIQRRISTDHLTWNSQFDGLTINSSVLSGESDIQPVANNGDCSAGLLWTHKYSDNKAAHIGFGAFHLTRPNYTLFTQQQSNIRWSFHADVAVTAVANKIYLYPSLFVNAQSLQRQYLLGGYAKYTVGKKALYTGFNKQSDIFIGLFARIGDALIICSGFDYHHQFQMHISYDVITSKLNNASLRGGVELSMQFTIPDKQNAQ